MMNDYEDVPRRVRRNGSFRIAGQTEQLCNDIRAAEARICLYIVV